ncbi:PREDICTED: helicase SKI2W-like [Priapulus caudatus]|uniref:Helicase SKI2W-like n=1 Tax=Priapulus caudatus TaxID=37621 RepID=A0ABM1EFV7_PRICU|nr:PREDICTED: helicase SKI2W-like [Priapulus caudatus]
MASELPSSLSTSTKSKAPFELPPVLIDLETRLEQYLKSPEKLLIHDFRRSQRFIQRVPDPAALLVVDLPAVPTTIKVTRDPTTGQLLSYKEDAVGREDETSKNSTSMRRAPGPLDEAVRGSSSNFPFWPGGMDEPSASMVAHSDGLQELDFENGLLSTPPGFSQGMSFNVENPPDKITEALPKPSKKNIFNVVDVLGGGDDDTWLSDEEQWEEDEQGLQAYSQKLKSMKQEEDQLELNKTAKIHRSDSLERLTKVSDRPAKMPPPTAAPTIPREEWAVWVDISTPVEDFFKKIPDLAYKWPFELDIFQKQAILHLENHESVFVAAHTSAGKTVVAEYAIALSAKHMTRTIYTSPIKALSNQKFRDFKQTFGDVGLLTGDVQIRPEAHCLIMTTEILRSMLYNGADTIRDLEWVIFDEVHYINDSERGVVWEEVLIMLPDHCNIILLSATVPNTMEFAEWVGRTKKKKVYVISTLKRPIPLEHFIYTGNSTKTSNEMFLLVDANKNFLSTGYQKAVDAKKARASKSSTQFGAKGTRQGNTKQDKGVWLSIVDMLGKKNQLPVVAFTFSKKRCDENASQLSSLDLLTAAGKSEVHVFFQRCISRLKGTDKELPQVIHMQDLLKRGVGVHHSGILPIIKEVIEMLFQRGLVKLLFATETFAMGVNMPARTVIFDSLRKHDGTNFRDLLPGEYIQMAGRAGRRGLDTTGTVIMLCKGDVPELSDLHKIILGKPTKLESQFRLTYSMILNLLRIEALRVEDMMKRSFSEFHTQKDVARHKAELEKLKVYLDDMKPIECQYCDDSLEQFYTACKKYVEMRNHLQDVSMSHPQMVKALATGRILVIHLGKQQQQLGLLLKVTSGRNEKKFATLVLTQKDEEICDKRKSNASKDASHVMDSFSVDLITDTGLFLPENGYGHAVVELVAADIVAVTTKTIKVAADKVIDDFNKRQLFRFKNDPPSQSASLATQELLRLTETNLQGLTALHPVNDLGIRDIDLVEQFMEFSEMKAPLKDHRCLLCPQFSQHFEQMKSNMKVKEEIMKVKYLMSDESLQLLPEYSQRKEVLEVLRYVDDNCAVQLKGRVACEIANNELVITELVFENVFSDRPPAEIAALLSCMVFQQKHCSEPNLSPTLSTGIEKIKSVAESIGKVQKQCGLTEPVEDYVARLNFGLVEVTHEWAKGVPFAEITRLTDVTEGIVVRTIQRLNETLRDVRNAARLVGDPVLCQKMEEASSLIKRDIVFAASLYTQ